MPSSEHMEFLKYVRSCELERALTHFPPPVRGGSASRVLEIGAGTGQQAERISKAGYDVTAIDVERSSYRNARVFNVIEYDGVSIPYEDGAFDVVFSSNVLEHVAGIDAFLDETRRVMAPNGIAVHVLPSPATRFWGVPAHYIWLSKRVFARLTYRRRGNSTVARGEKPRTPVNAHEWLGTFFPLRHGERGNTITELFYFSCWWWTRKFGAHGLTVVDVDRNRLFYTMANSMTTKISLAWRKRLSTIMGSACTIYILHRNEVRDD